MDRASYLDDNQYAIAEIAKYEAIYGRDFVSPGGRETSAELIARLELDESDRVLDVGCGLGGAAFLMAREYGARVLGIDLSRNMVTEAQRRLAAYQLEDRVTIEHGDCLALTGEDRFTVVHSRDVFLHVHAKHRLFVTLHRLLVSGGSLLFTDYLAGPKPWSTPFARYVAGREYDLKTVEEYVELLHAVGFVDIEGVDLTATFIAIQEEELERLSETHLSPTDRAKLRESWRAKVERSRAGEHRWGVFTARAAP